MKVLNQFISIILILCFVLTESARSAPGLHAKALRHSLFNISDQNRFDLPIELGSVDHIYAPETRRNYPTIIHIKTAHGIYSGAKKLQNIIGFLTEQYGIDRLYIEGASESLRPELMKFFEDKKLNHELAERLAQAGWVTGAELGVLQSHKDIKTFGIEDANIYRQSYLNFKHVLNQHHEIESVLKKHKQSLDQKASQILDSDTRKILGAWMRFESDKSSLAGVLKQLEHYANQRLEIDLQDPLKQFEWPQLARVSFLQKLEESLDNHDFENERNAAVGEFGEKKLKPLLHILDHKNPEAPRLFFETYFEKNGFILENYPQLKNKAAYQVIQREVNPNTLFDEIQLLFTKLINTETQTEDQKKLIKQYQAWLLSAKLGRLELTRDEWDIISQEGFLIGSKQPWVKVAFEFYRLAVEREKIFLNKMLKGDLQSPGKPVVLITGGFHTKGMQVLFEKNNMAYVLLTPNLESLEGNTYHEIMLGRSYLEQTPLLQSARSKFLQGWNLRSEARNVFRLFRHLAREQGLSQSEMRGVWKQSPYAQDRGPVLRSEVRARKNLGIEELEGRRMFASVASEVLDITSTSLETNSLSSEQAEIRTIDLNETPVAEAASIDASGADAFFSDLEDTSFNTQIDQQLLESNIHAIRPTDEEIILEIHGDGIDYLQNFTSNEITLTFEGMDGEESRILTTHDGHENVQVNHLVLTNGDALIHLEELATDFNFEADRVLVHIYENETHMATIEVRVERSHGSNDHTDHDHGSVFIGNGQIPLQDNTPNQNAQDQNGQDHSGHDHSGHDHSGHDHSGHDHSGHNHGGHDHGGSGSDHSGHDHGPGDGDNLDGHDHSGSAGGQQNQSNFGLPNNGVPGIMGNNHANHGSHSHSGFDPSNGLASPFDHFKSPHSNHDHSHPHSQFDPRRHNHDPSQLHQSHNLAPGLRAWNHRHIIPTFEPFWGFLKQFLSDSDVMMTNMDNDSDDESVPVFDRSYTLSMNSVGPHSWKFFTVFAFIMSAIASYRFWRKDLDFMKRMRETRKRARELGPDQETVNPSLVTKEEFRRMKKMQWMYLSTYFLSLFLFLAIPTAFYWEHPQNPVRNFVDHYVMNKADQGELFTDNPPETTPNFLIFSRDMRFPQAFKQGLTMFEDNALSFEVSLPPTPEGQATLVVFELLNQRREVVYSLTWMSGKNNHHYYHSSASDESEPPRFSYDTENGILRFSVTNQTLAENLRPNDQLPQMRIWANRPNGVFLEEEQKLFGVTDFNAALVDSWQESNVSEANIPRIAIKTTPSVQSEPATYISRRFLAEVHNHGGYHSDSYSPRDFTNDIFRNHGLNIIMSSWENHDLDSMVLQFNSGDPKNHATLVRYLIEKKDDKWVAENGITVHRRGGELVVNVPSRAATSYGIVGSVHLEASFKLGGKSPHELPPIRWSFGTNETVPISLGEIYRLQQARYSTISIDEQRLEAIEHLNGSWIHIPRRSGHMIQALDILLTNHQGQDSLWSIKRPPIDPNDWRSQSSNVGLDQKGWKGSYRAGGNIQEIPLQPVIENNDTVAFFIPREILHDQIEMTPHVTFEAERLAGSVAAHYSSLPDLSMIHTQTTPDGFAGLASTDIPDSLNEVLRAKPDHQKKSSFLFSLSNQQAEDFRRLPPDSILEMEFEHPNITDWPEIHFHFQYFRNQHVTFFHPVATREESGWVLTDPNNPSDRLDMSIQYQAGKLKIRIPSQRVLETSFYPLLRIGVSIGNPHSQSSSYSVRGAITSSAQFTMPEASRSEARTVTPFFLAFYVFGGMSGINWSKRKRNQYNTYIREQLQKSLFGEWDRTKVESQVQVLNDHSKDSISLPHNLTTVEREPIIIQFISRALTVKDKELLISRLQDLPKGSVLIEYTQQGQETVLAAELQPFPDLQYIRKSYLDKLNLKTVKQQLVRAQGMVSTDRQHVANVGFLLAGLEDLDSLEEGELNDLGLIFMLGDKTIQRFAPLMQDSIRAAVFGRLIEYVKLDRQIQDAYLREKVREGYLGLGGVVFSIEKLWVDFRTQAHLKTQA